MNHTTVITNSNLVASSASSKLLALPGELLQTIMDYAFANQRPQSLLFVATIVERLDIDDALFAYALDGTRNDAQPLDAVSLTHNLTQLFQHRFSRLEAMDVDCRWVLNGPLFAALASSAVGPDSFPALVWLRVSTGLEDQARPFDSRNWAFLAKFPRLWELTLQVGFEYDIPADPVPPPLLPLPPLPTVTRLRLGKLFPSVEVLDIVGGEDIDPLLAYLPSVPNPSNLWALEVTGHHEPNALTTLLPRFPNLQYLEIGNNDEPREPAFYAAIRELPDLSTLTLNDQTSISGEDLVHFVGSAPQHPSFAKLELNAVEGWRGVSIKDYGASWDKYEQEWRVHPEWTKPEFDEIFSADHVDQLVVAAKASQVELSGCAIQAAGIWRDYHEEERMLEERWGAGAPPPFSKAELEFYTTKRHLA
ncbi:hypothetical protein JCM11641_001565 [Rhodosporidiobolus odoratus]